MTRPGGALTSSAAKAWLEAFGLEGRPPDSRFFEDLFLRFQRRVASETLTRPAGNARLFDAEAFAAAWPGEERGLTGRERAAAFSWLATSLGFTCELRDSSCSRPWAGDLSSKGPGGVAHLSMAHRSMAHRAVVASIEGQRILADAGFPLPVLLRLDTPSKEIPTGFGTLSVRIAQDDGAECVECDARGEVTELLRLLPNPPHDRLPLEEVRGPSSGAPSSPVAEGDREPFALRVLDDRVLFWRAGRMTILDAWSRLEYPLAGSHRAALEKLFALELEGVDLPLSPAADAPRPASLTVRHVSAASPGVARERLAGEARRLLLVTDREEEVEEAAGGSRVTIRATLADVPPEGPGEAVRKTLVFHLVSEIFALSEGERPPRGEPGTAKETG